MKSQRWIIRDKLVAELEEFEFDNENLSPREVVIEVDYSAVSPGTECANYQALDPDVYKPDGWCAYPWQPGYAGAGRIIAKGEAVTEFEIGERVIGTFPHARHYRMSADWMVVPLRAGLDPQLATYTRMLSISMHSVESLTLNPFAPAAVWGLGTMGNLVAQLLRSLGFRVVGIDPVAARRELAGRCGITTTLDPRAADFEAQLKAFAPEGLVVGVDVVGNAMVTTTIPSYLARRGQMVLMTHWRSQPPVDGNDFIHKIFTRGITVRGALDGSNAGLLGPNAGTDWAALQRQKYSRLQEKIAIGELLIEPLISHRVRPQQANETYMGLCFQPESWWGAVVDWT